MKYYYEYKEKNGTKVGGHNLEDITIKNNAIILEGTNYLEKNYESYDMPWQDILNPKEIEYLKIEPMEEEYE